VGLKVIDGDGHIFEDIDGIRTHLPRKYRDAFEAGRLIQSAGLFPPLSSFHAMPVHAYGFAGLKGEVIGVDEWLRFLDEVGIAETVLYPSWALTIGLVRDLSFAPVLCTAYNDWVAETYLAHPSGKLKAVALLPMQTPEAAAEELRRASALGFVGGFVPGKGLTNHLGSPQYWPVYEAAEELDCGLSIHGAYHQNFGFDDFNHLAPAHALGHPFALLTALGGMVFNSVYDRFPGLRTAFLEGGSAWIMMAAERFAESYSALPTPEWEERLQLREGTGVDDYLMDLVASRRLVIGCEGGEAHLGRAIDYLGANPFMYSSDFPHEVDAVSCRHEIDEIRELEFKSDDIETILSENARYFYKL
jgi:predicted TIM-barrel fold metal-dependent hydrolase